MTNWWQELSQRERLLVGLMAALGGLLFISFGVIKPALGFKAKAEQNLVSAKATAAFVDQAVLSSAAGTNLRTNRSASEIRSIIAGFADQTGVRLNNSRLTEDDLAVTVSISNLTTDDLFGWLVDLQEREGVIVRDARIARNRNGEGVQAQVTFSDGG